MNEQTPWTLFWDMHSGGGSKEKWDKIYIQAPKDVACIVFYNRFGHSADRVSCTCCGADYSVSESETLEDASGYHRGCEYEEDGNTIIEKPTSDSWRKYQTIDEYRANPNVLVIPEEEIKPEEKIGEIPRQGYVWND